MQKTLLAVIAAALVTVGLTVNFAGAAGTPADKVSASGSTAEVAAPGEEVTLLSEKVRSSNTADLILGVTSECVITTALTTVGNDAAEAEGTVDIWIEIDGNAVPVSSDDEDDVGKVTFCNSSSVARRRTSTTRTPPSRRSTESARRTRSTGSPSTSVAASTRSRSRPT